jgi:transcription antitermination factor NusG
MPLLPAEPCCYPENLFSFPDPGGGELWWILHTRPRTEKALARALLAQGVPHFLPTYERTVRVRGRLQTSHHPLFPGYVFLRANRDGRIIALSTKYVASCLQVVDQERLRTEVERVHKIMHTQLPLGSEAQLLPGSPIVIRRGALAGIEGKVVRLGKKLKLVVEIEMLRQGVWVEIESWMVEPAEILDSLSA